MSAWPAKALWECYSCGEQGTAIGEVGKQPNTPDGPGDADFYPERDEETELPFIGCLRCGSEEVGFDDVKPVVVE